MICPLADIGKNEAPQLYVCPPTTGTQTEAKPEPGPDTRSRAKPETPSGPTRSTHWNVARLAPLAVHPLTPLANEGSGRRFCARRGRLASRSTTPTKNREAFMNPSFEEVEVAICKARWHDAGRA